MVQILTILACSSIFSCQSNGITSPTELVDFVDNPSNGFIQEKEVGEFRFEAKWRPLVYELAKSSLNNQSIKNLDQEDKDYYITLKINHQSGQNITEWNASDMKTIQQNIYYLSYTMQKDIYLEDGDEKLECVHFVFERSYDLAGYSIINLGFEPKEWNNKTKILVIDGMFFNVPPIKLKFKEEKLSRLPHLKV